MKHPFPFLAGTLGLLLITSAGAEPLVKPNDRVAFCGDNMTADLGYTVYVEDYLLACQQVPGLVTAQFGWSAQTPEGFLTRLDTDLVPFRPTLATICYTGGDAKTRHDSEQRLIKALKSTGVKTIVLASPPCVGSDFDQNPAKVAGFNATLSVLAQIDKDLAAKEGIVFADVFGATTAVEAKAKEKLGPDYVVDKDGRSLAIAYAFLKALGCDGEIGTITVHFTSNFHIGKAEATPGHSVLSFDDQTLKAQSARYAFFFPGYPSGKPLPDPFPSCVPFDAELNRFRLVVKDLPSPQAKVYWNDQWHDYSAEELAQGVNLAADIPCSCGKFQDMDNAVRNHLQGERIAGQALLQGKPDPKAAADAEASFALAKSRVVPMQYTLRIQPLAAAEKQPPGPVNVIVDTDMNSDCDDAGAVALLNDFMCQGEANIIACNVNTHDAAKSSGAVIQAINAYYGHPQIPIGAYYGDDEPTCSSMYTAAIRKQFAPDFPKDDQLPRGVDVYRKALASSADRSVVICSIGWMGNIIDLLKSEPDDVYRLSGVDLVKQKVRKLVVMANTNPNDVWVVKNWPTPILWTTDIGNYVYPGKSLTTTPEDNPVRIIYKLNRAEGGRQGWDPTTAWLAVRGPGDLWEIATGGYWRVNVPPATYGTWVNGPQTHMGMATVKMPSAQVLKLMDAELARPPKPRP